MAYYSFANIVIPQGWLWLDELVKEAGGVSGTGVSSNGALYVPDVTQEALDLAVSSHDELALSSQAAMQQLRSKRNTLLTESDFTQLPDYSASNKTAYAIYRQELRDLPANTVDVMNPIWPTKPAS